MSTKPDYSLLTLATLICFAPTALLWALAIFTLASISLDAYSSDSSIFIRPSIDFLIISIVLLILGGVGLVGVYQMMNHIYCHGYQLASARIYRKLYAGLISLLILNLIIVFYSDLLIAIVIFILPIICSIYLIKLTRRFKYE